MKTSDSRRDSVLLLLGLLLTAMLCICMSHAAHALTKEEAKIASAKGWHSLPGGKITYIQKDLTPADGFLKLKKKWYHFDENGYLSTGWFVVNGKRYFGTETGAVGKKRGSLKSGYAKADGEYYLFNKKNKAGKFGAQQLGWIKEKNNTYYYAPDGTKMMGLQEVNGRIYYFVPSGSAKKRGRIKTGWKKIDGKKYYFRPSGKMGKTYGAAYRNKTVKINGKKYSFDDDGSVSAEEIVGTEAQKKFIKKIGKMAHDDMKSKGVLASVTVAQAIVESAFGTSTLAKKANNLFGMKAAIGGSSWKSDWDGKTYKKKTQEYINGSYITITDTFRKYPNYEASVADHSDYLLGAKLSNGKLRYKGIKGCTDYKKAATIIKNGGYATAPNYVSALVGVIERYNLTVYDS